MYDDWTYLQLLTEIQRRGLRYSTAGHSGFRDEADCTDMRAVLEAEDRLTLDFKPHCPDCLSGQIAGYRSRVYRRLSLPYYHCRACGHTFLPAQAVLLRDLPPQENWNERLQTAMPELPRR
jgi:predicted RNA-binding Zn-ribbon protein involved in translation (DUF1610 family)